MTVNFAPQPIGEKDKKYIWIENISSKHFSLKSTLLDPSGPFGISNALPSNFAPGEKHKILFSFVPVESVAYQEGVEIQCFENSKLNSSIRINVRGYGQMPKCKLIGAENDEMDLGVALINHTNTNILTLQNEADFDIQYR